MAAGGLAGFTNVLAGGGSLLTLPALMALGLPAGVANATNRVAIVLQNVAGLQAYKTKGITVPARGWLLALPACAGTLVGVWLATQLTNAQLRRVFGALFLVMLVVLMLRPKRWLEQRDEPVSASRWISWPIFFALGIYGGFIQAGVGVVLLAAIVLAEGHDLVVGNAVKIAIVLVYTTLAVAYFAHVGLIAWIPGLALAVGNVCGAVVAARMASDRGAAWVYRVLLVVVAVTGVKLAFFG